MGNTGGLHPFREEGSCGCFQSWLPLESLEPQTGVATVLWMALALALPKISSEPAFFVL